MDSTSLAACNCSVLITSGTVNVPNCGACFSQNTACLYCQDAGTALTGYCAPDNFVDNFPANCSWIPGKVLCGTSGAAKCSQVRRRGGSFVDISSTQPVRTVTAWTFAVKAVGASALGAAWRLVRCVPLGTSLPPPRHASPRAAV